MAYGGTRGQALIHDVRDVPRLIYHCNKAFTYSRYFTVITRCKHFPSISTIHPAYLTDTLQGNIAAKIAAKRRQHALCTTQGSFWPNIGYHKQPQSRQDAREPTSEFRAIMPFKFPLSRPPPLPLFSCLPSFNHPPVICHPNLQLILGFPGRFCGDAAQTVDYILSHLLCAGTKLG